MFARSKSDSLGDAGLAKLTPLLKVESLASLAQGQTRVLVIYLSFPRLRRSTCCHQVTRRVAPLKGNASPRLLTCWDKISDAGLVNLRDLMNSDPNLQQTNVSDVGLDT